MLFIPLQKLVKGKAFKVAEREDSVSWYEIWVVPPLDPAEEGDAYQVRHRATVRGVSQPIDMVPLFLVPFILQALSQPTSCQEELFQEPVGHTASLDRALSYLRDRVGEALERGVDLGGYYADEVWHGIRDSDWDEAEYRNAYTHGVGASDIPEECFRRDHGRVFSQDEITEAILEVVGASRIPEPVVQTEPPVRLGALVERALNEGQRLGNYLLVDGEFMSAWNILWDPGEYRRTVQILPIFLSGGERRFRHEHEPAYGQEAITEAVIQAIHDRQVPF
jgi:hypothetical protein